MQAVPHGIARWCLTMYEFAILVYLGIMHVRAGRGDEFRSIGTFIGVSLHNYMYSSTDFWLSLSS